ncbi:MAG: glycoside hydrolase family 31 protein [Actinomyces sp.]|nr:glycoside hydrolase family 31 protein [Actinomyces sp.]
MTLQFFQHHSSAATDPAAIVQGDHWRISVLTSRLIRLEWSPSGEFVDAETPMVLTRHFDVPDFSIDDEGDEGILTLRTEHLLLRYDRQAFSPSGLSISLRHRAQSGHHTTWRFGDPQPVQTKWGGNMGGTARTLDDVDGATEIGPGILATDGFSVLDDSESVIYGDDADVAEGSGYPTWVKPRPEGHQDLYFFGYGRDFHAALQDFFALTGQVPLLPRRALGNWWSRYWPYTSDEYLALMERFAHAQMPFSVGILDMDWHKVDIDPAIGSGWTGYSWNRDLIPDPSALLENLHRRGMLTSLNLHPADGVRRHEDAYEAMAHDMGIDPDSGAEIPFDIANPCFVGPYLEHLHHPLEEQGVDFWWLDWQQGTSTRIAGLDPLWMLNHIHTIDSARTGKRPMILSRYCGPGSHRYPVGFSGDTVTSWDSLEFQPRFTATAANIGYFWWSHDIGGHMLGTKDEELTARWFQFGAFSPINRLHSSADPFNSKEPMRFGLEVRQTLIDFLRLRHRLVPYLYTAMWAAHSHGIGIVRPMYQDYPTKPEAFGVPNQYMFGPDMIVAPITAPRDAASRLASVKVWLPHGTWTDLFTGITYEGNRTLTMYRPIEQIPVLVRAGAALTLNDDPMSDAGANPETIVLRVIPGTCESIVDEDDGSLEPGPDQRYRTVVSVSEDARSSSSMKVRIASAAEYATPRPRRIILDLAGVIGIGEVSINCTHVDVSPHLHRVDDLLAPAMRMDLGMVSLDQPVEIRLCGVEKQIDIAQAIFAVLDRAHIQYTMKGLAWKAAQRYLSGSAQHKLEFIQELMTLELPESVIEAIAELTSTVVCDEEK